MGQMCAPSADWWRTGEALKFRVGFPSKSSLLRGGGASQNLDKSNIWWHLSSSDFFFFLCFTNTFHIFHSPKDLGKRWLHVRATLTNLCDSFVAALPGAPVLCSNPELPSHPGGLLTAGFLWWLRHHLRTEEVWDACLGSCRGGHADTCVWLLEGRANEIHHRVF